MFPVHINVWFTFRKTQFSDIGSCEERRFCEALLSVPSCFRSVLDLNAFERQNKAEGLGMVTEEGSGIDYLT